MTTASPVPPPEAPHRELTRERLQSAHRINALRLGGVSAFFVLFLVLGGLLRLPAWTGNLTMFAGYWASSTTSPGSASSCTTRSWPSTRW